MATDGHPDGHPQSPDSPQFARVLLRGWVTPSIGKGPNSLKVLRGVCICWRRPGHAQSTRPRTQRGYMGHDVREEAAGSSAAQHQARARRTKRAWPAESERRHNRVANQRAAARTPFPRHRSSRVGARAVVAPRAYASEQQQEPGQTHQSPDLLARRSSESQSLRGRSHRALPPLDASRPEPKRRSGSAAPTSAGATAHARRTPPPKPRWPEADRKGKVVQRGTRQESARQAVAGTSLPAAARLAPAIAVCARKAAARPEGCAGLRPPPRRSCAGARAAADAANTRYDRRAFVEAVGSKATTTPNRVAAAPAPPHGAAGS